MIFPQTIAEVQRLIDNEVQESLHLDYKESRAVDKSHEKKLDIAKDISAFANSDGGVLIYGVKEVGHLPTLISGVDHNTFKREWFEEVIRTNISPTVPGIEIVQIPIDLTTSVFAVRVPKSYRAPHQAKNKLYYRRYNFQSVSMEDYEINDIRNRRQIVPPLLNIRAFAENNSVVYLEVANVGQETAINISFEVPSKISEWANENCVKIFKEGVKFLAPNERRAFMYGTSHALLSENYKYPAQFEITATYLHPRINQNLTEIFYIDLKSYIGASIIKSDIETQGEKIEKAIKELTGEIKKASDSLTKLANISGASGLDLSVSALKNLKRIVEKRELEKLDPLGLNYLTLIEILDINLDLALQLERFFKYNSSLEKLIKIDGITPTLLKKIEENFILTSDVAENTPL